MSDERKDDQEPADIPALFATIHFQSSERPRGYTAEELAELNRAMQIPAGRGSK